MDLTESIASAIFFLSIHMQRGQFGNFFQVILSTRKDSVLKFLTQTKGEGRKFQDRDFPGAEDNLKMKLYEVKYFIDNLLTF